jgi:hypothetical protein
MTGSALAVAVFIVPGFSLADLPPPVEQGSFAIQASQEPDGEWIAPAIEVTTTAVGVSWQPGRDPGEVAVRASSDGSVWGPWIELNTEIGDHGPDASTAEASSVRPASDPVYVGEAEYVQFRGSGLGNVSAEWIDTSGRHMNVLDRISHFFDRLTWGEKSPVVAQPDLPPMVTRAEWGGDACLGPDPHELEYADRVEAIFVHHTNHGGDENGYAADEVKDLIYAICNYHVQIREFWDIGYNFLIDKYGVIYEGRRGGVDSTVIGAHTGGFNSYSTGIGFIGDHGTVVPSAAAQEAFKQLAAWKLDVHHIDPDSTVILESLESTLYPEGEMVTFRTVSGHRDAASTACPGNACYSLINPLRAVIAPIEGPKIFGGWPASEPIEGLPDTGYVPSAFPARFTEAMTWEMVISDLEGTELARFDGSGTEAKPTWSGTVGGEPLPVGDYTVELIAVPLSGAAPPRPAHFTFQLGSFYPPFSDDDDSPHADNIGAIFEAGVTQGCDVDLYCPADAVTRWQMAIFLRRTWELLGLEPVETGDPGFSDLGGLPPEAVLSINQIAALEITTGTSPGLFSPYRNLTRWQMALFITRFWEQIGIYEMPVVSGNVFEDIAELPPDVQLAIEQLAGLGITSGTTPTTYDPYGVVTRGQMATFLTRTLQGLGWNPEAP